MKIVFTNHAKYRLEERKISVENVKSVIKNSTSQKSDKYGMIVSRKIIDKKSFRGGL